MNFSRYDANDGLHASRADFYIQDAQQVADMPASTMPMEAFEPADGPLIVGLEIGRTAI